MKNLLLAIMLFFPFVANAQEEKKYPFEDLYLEMDTMSLEHRTQLEANIKAQEEKFRKEQVKGICGVPFESSKEKALSILKNKYGEPLGSLGLKFVFESISYAGQNFNTAIFSFQSDGLNTYLYQCIFVKNAKTFNEALDLEKEFADVLSEKYTNMYRLPDENGNPMHVCGISPFWNGNMRDLTTSDNMAIHTSIIATDNNTELTTGAKYYVRIIYGPYNYVKEEF